MTESDLHKLSAFHKTPMENTSTISRQHPLGWCKQDNMATSIMKRRLLDEMDWACHPKTAGQFHLNWSSMNSKRKTIKRLTQSLQVLLCTMKGELKTLHHTWSTINTLAQNRQEWGILGCCLTVHANTYKGQ